MKLKRILSLALSGVLAVSYADWLRRYRQQHQQVP